MITLVIIGVIAALTVPSLMQQTNKKEDVARVKKAYSVLQNSIHKITLDKGYAQGDYSYITDTNTFFDSFEKTVSVMKRCNNSFDCMAHDSKGLNNSIMSLSGSEYAVITQDGIAYSFRHAYDFSYFGIKHEDEDKYLGRFWVDINGKKKPDIVGKDLFAFVLIQGKGILPAGYGNNSADCYRGSAGFTCAAKVLKEGDINY